MARDVMNTLLLPFSIVFIGSLLIQLLAVVIYKRRNTRRYGKQVVATVKQIQVWLDGWYVTAVWTDMVTQRIYTFEGMCIAYELKQHVGDSVIVHVDPRNPERYSMQF
jgi:hypothetical protein